MTLSPYMDPLNWAHRFYLIQSIKKCGFDGGWEPIIQHVKTLTQTFLHSDFNITPNECHLFYLQILAEFGIYKYFSDPLIFPPDNIVNKITEMRQSQLRHELLLVNNQIRYNNYILKHHKAEMIIPKDLKWVRTDADTPTPLFHQNQLVSIFISAKTEQWYSIINQEDSRGKYGKINRSLDSIFSRYISGVTTTPIEVLRDVELFVTNLRLDGKPDIQRGIDQMEHYFLEKLAPFLEDNSQWKKLQTIIEEVRKTGL